MAILTIVSMALMLYVFCLEPVPITHVTLTDLAWLLFSIMLFMLIARYIFRSTKRPATLAHE